MAKSKKNKFDKSNRYFDDFEDQNFRKKKSLKNKRENKDDFREELDNYYNEQDDNNYSSSDIYSMNESIESFNNEDE
jgi:hypothetical protein